MNKVQFVVSLLILMASWSSAQQSPLARPVETRNPVTVRSPYSTAADMAVPLCPQHFHDTLKTNGIADPYSKGVRLAKVKKTVPAAMTEAAIEGAGNTHIGNFLVILNVLVDAKGNPSQVCLAKSSGYGLDASAAAAVRQYQFDSANMIGRPVRSRLPVEVRFVTPKPPPIGMSRTGDPPK
jgi:TonB family protein